MLSIADMEDITMDKGEVKRIGNTPWTTERDSMGSLQQYLNAAFRHANRTFQIACAVLLLALGGLLLATLVLQAPTLINSSLSGDERAVETIIGSTAGAGLCWLQWRYRHVVYPRLRRDFRIRKRGASIISHRSV
ncbi:hypothetical protein CEG14_23610 [Bordetella genomosp. 1]|uniref:Uncharacterized protein n=1 Tax=Bordetella genomosp. 1 TaxID=1395607 RepID=A0A261RV38_9BORD|nr:hypothetical protein CEG14_23610 [Bordetella genomosp. 1]